MIGVFHATLKQPPPGSQVVRRPGDRSWGQIAGRAGPLGEAKARFADGLESIHLQGSRDVGPLLRARHQSAQSPW
jgi:hypothetical protein